MWFTTSDSADFGFRPANEIEEAAEIHAGAAAAHKQERKHDEQNDLLARELLRRVEVVFIALI